MIIHVFDINFGLRTGDCRAQVKPNIFWNVDRRGETWTIVDLPVETRVQYWRVLDRIRQAPFMWPKVDPLAVGAIIRQPKLNAEKASRRGCCDVDVDHRIAHLQIFQGCGPAIEEERLAVLVFSYLRLPF